ncbi:MAG: hypothetical protein ACT4NU_10125 [Chromatiales bacterium]
MPTAGHTVQQIKQQLTTRISKFIPEPVVRCRPAGHLGIAYLRKGDKINALASLRKAVATREPYLGLEQAKSALRDMESAG